MAVAGESSCGWAVGLGVVGTGGGESPRREGRGPDDVSIFGGMAAETERAKSTVSIYIGGMRHIG